MYVIKADSEIIRSREVQDMLDRYEEKFGERFIAFNYADFPGAKGGPRPAEMYRETLRKALEEGKPYHVRSKRYDFFDH